MKRLRLIFLSLPFLLLTGCILSDLASDQLYPIQDANTDRVPASAPTPLQNFLVTGADGHKTTGWYFHNAAVADNAPVVLYFHGNGSNIEGEYKDTWVPKMMAFNTHFAMFDYPKYGLSTGELDEKGVLVSGQDAIDFVKKQFPSSPIIVLAHSLGCGPAINLVSTNQDSVKKLVLAACWDEFWHVVKFNVNLPDSQCKDAAEGNEYLSDISSQSIHNPVLFFHGTKDDTIPFSLGQNLASSFAPGVSTFEPVVGANHDNLLGDKQWGEILEFIFK